MSYNFIFQEFSLHIMSGKWETLYSGSQYTFVLRALRAKTPPPSVCYLLLVELLAAGVVLLDPVLHLESLLGAGRGGEHAEGEDQDHQPLHPARVGTLAPAGSVLACCGVAVSIEKVSTFRGNFNNVCRSSPHRIWMLVRKIIR